MPDLLKPLCYLSILSLYISAFSEGDGHIDPYSLTQAFAIGARMYGAKIYMPAPVTKLNQLENGKWEVETPHGTIRAKRIINASGKYIMEELLYINHDWHKFAYLVHTNKNCNYKVIDIFICDALFII